MNSKSIIFALVAVLLITGQIIPMQEAGAQATPVVSGNVVTIDTTDIHIEATPAILTSSGWVDISFYTKSYNGEVDLVYGFNGNDKVKAINPLVWESYEHKLTRPVPVVQSVVFKPKTIVSIAPAQLSEELATRLGVSAKSATLLSGKGKLIDPVVLEKTDTDAVLNNNFAQIKYIGSFLIGEQSEEVSKTIDLAYDTYDEKTGEYTYKYNGTASENYTSTFEDWNVKSQITETTLSYASAIKWDTTSYKAIAPSILQKARVWIDMPFSGFGIVSGKYNIGIKPSALTLQQAKDQGKLWLLDPWYNSSWSSRKEIVINGSSDNTVTNYPLKLIVYYLTGTDNTTNKKIYTSNLCNTDFSDLRFTSADNSTMLDYWVESSYASENATLWVEVPTITASTTTSIYMYYGNSGATSLSNGGNTFDLFDDFNDSSIDTAKWNTGITPVESGGVMALQDTDNITSKTSFGLFHASVARVLCYDMGPYAGMNGFYGDSTNYALWWESDVSWSSNSWEGTVQQTLNLSTIHNYIWDILEIGRSGVTSDKFYVNSILKVTHSTKVPEDNEIFYAAGYSSAECQLDWVAIRNYTGNEPTYASFGAEEASIDAQAGIATYWLPGWTYRKAFTISPLHDSFTNYQVKLLLGESSGATGEQVDCGGLVASDFDDLRFTTFDGRTLCDYWIESLSGSTPNQLATVWVEVPKIYPSPYNTTIYMYYGGTQTAVSNGPNTFLFFDHFDGDLTKWAGDTANVVVSSSVATITATSAAYKKIYPASSQVWSGDICVRSRYKINNIDYSYLMLGLTPDAYIIYVYHDSGYPNHSAWHIYDGSTVNSYSNQAIGFGNFHIYELRRELSGTNKARYFYDDVEVGAGTTTLVPTQALTPIIVAYNNTASSAADWLLMRKYVTTEPVWSAFGGQAVATAPVLTASSGVLIGSTFFTDNATVTSNGSDNITEEGFAWGTTSKSPTTENLTASGYDSNWSTLNNATTYTDNFTSLAPASLYYSRAAAKNLIGWGWSAENTTLTLPINPTGLTPTPQDGQVDFLWTNASGGTGTTISTQVQYKIGSYPTSYSDGTTGIAWTTGTSGSVTSLTNTQLYYFAAFTKAVNSTFTQYSTTSAQITSTPAVKSISVETVSYSSVSTTTATTTENITVITGALKAVKHGTQYGSNSTTYGAWENTTADTTSAPYSWNDSLAGLSQATVYYFRGFATDNLSPVHSYFGSQKEFLTVPDKPTGQTATPGFNQIVLGWINNVVGTGAAENTTIRYDTTGYPTVSTGTQIYNGTGTSYTHTGLTSGQSYYYSFFSYAWATDNVTLAKYSSAAQVTATPSTVATITISAASSVENVTAVLNGNITDTGGLNPTVTVYWGTVDHPGTATGWDHSSAPTSPAQPQGVAAFSYNVTGLSTGTTYYFTAKANNAMGDSWPVASLSFLTKPAAPTAISATDGTSPNYVTITWSVSTGATSYTIYRDVSSLGVQSSGYQDTGAAAPAITAGAASATDATSAFFTTLTVSGQSVSNGTTSAYKVKATNATGSSDNGTADNGFKGTSSLTYQWQKSAADSDASYSPLAGATTATYNDTAGVATPDGRYYYCTLSATGSVSQDTTHDRGCKDVWIGPTVVTGICSGYMQTTAVLNGNITAQGTSSVTQRGFDYGLTNSYGSSVVTTSLTSYANGTYSSSLSALTPSTQYHYRAKAYNGQWSYGNENIFSTTGSPAIGYYFQTAADNVTNIYGVNWASQTFTTDNSTSKTITSIRLLLNRVGSPGTVTVSVRDTSAGVPTGVDLVSGTINGNSIDTSPTWYLFTMTTEKALSISTKYAICVSAPSGDGSNYIQWRYVTSGGFANGNGLTSVNSGLAWTTKTWDYDFEAWGNSTVYIQDVKIFTGYKQYGDWLIVCRYVNIFPPYSPNEDMRRYFVLQLLNASDTTIAANVLPAWGNKVASIYLSTTAATPLTYGGNYKVRIYGTFAGNPYTDYVLLPEDWKGSDLTNLDSWVISSASVIGNYYSTALTTYVTGAREVLNVTGAGVFSDGIAGLSSIRPKIFNISTNAIIQPAAAPNTQALQSRYIWQNTVGPQAAKMLTDVGNMLGGVPGDQVGQYLIFILWALIAGLVYPPGHTMAAVILDSPLLIWAVWIGFTNVGTMGILLFIMIIVLLWQFILKGAS